MIGAASDHVEQTFNDRRTSSLTAWNLLQRSHATLQYLDQRQVVTNQTRSYNIQEHIRQTAAGDGSNKQYRYE